MVVKVEGALPATMPHRVASAMRKLVSVIVVEEVRDNL